MKKLKYFILLLVAGLMIPFVVAAEDEVEPISEDGAPEEVAEKSEVPVYFFRGNGCSHCAEAEEWFQSIEEEHGSLFEIKDYETWYNEDNAELMQRVATARGETADGVPYIIVGNKSWNGFPEEAKEEIISEIKKVYEQSDSERYDIMKLLESAGTKDEEKKFF